MRPDLFTVPFLDWPVRSYGVALAVGLLAGVLLAERRVPRVGLPPGIVLDLGLAGVVAGLIGARATAVLENLDYFRERGWASVFAIWEGGLTFYGGFLAAMAVLFVVARRRGLDRGGTLELLDLGAPSLALALGFGRLGCFLNGCCFGMPSSLPPPLAVRFPVGSPPHLEALARAGFLDENHLFRAERLEALGVAPESVVDLETGVRELVASGALPGPEPLLATQLFEAALGLALFAFLYFYLWPRRAAPGQVAIGFLLVYPVGRFFEELLRGDNPEVLGPLTISQVLTLVVLAATGLWVLARRRSGVAPPAPARPVPPVRRRRRRRG